MIEIKHLSKTFQMKDGAVNALKDINLTIPDGSIYGIIGMSGAGKSTLVRCINLLERPTEGSVVIDGVEMEKLTPAQLRQRRRNGGQRPEQNELAQQPPRLLFDMIELIDADEQNRRRDQRRERQIIIQFHVRLPLFTSVERTSAIARAGCADRGARGGTAHT